MSLCIRKFDHSVRKCNEYRDSSRSVSSPLGGTVAALAQFLSKRHQKILRLLDPTVPAGCCGLLFAWIFLEWRMNGRRGKQSNLKEAEVETCELFKLVEEKIWWFHMFSLQSVHLIRKEDTRCGCYRNRNPVPLGIKTRSVQ